MTMVIVEQPLALPWSATYMKKFCPMYSRFHFHHHSKQNENPRVCRGRYRTALKGYFSKGIYFYILSSFHSPQLGLWSARPFPRPFSLTSTNIIIVNGGEHSCLTSSIGCQEPLCVMSEKVCLSKLNSQFIISLYYTARLKLFLVENSEIPIFTIC